MEKRTIMTPKQIKRNLSLLKVDGINRLLYDVLTMYICEVNGEALPNNLPEVSQEITTVLMNRYKEQLPKKVGRPKKVVQVDLEDSIAEMKATGPDNRDIRERLNNIANGRD